MIALLSPAKNMDFSPVNEEFSTTPPMFLSESTYLMAKLKKLSARQIGKMMNINPELSDVNYERFQNWTENHNNGDSKMAVLAFNGEVYRGLNAKSFNNEEMKFANDHIAILSGLYGLLRVNNSIKPYRLEMGSKLKVTPKQNNLYKFWNNKLSLALNKILEDHKENVVLNLASNEYIKAVDKKSLKGKFIDCQFLDLKNGEYKAVMTWAKKARGMMAHEIVKHRVDSLEAVKEQQFSGYCYNDKLSTGNSLTFTREEESN